ncbi:MAG TPA: glycerophosphodiester phosphodiesterase [Acidimicrobiia bacterium]|nr:glycerophosphodiester phosphodiesterase [Acidimicrobiia bacterium]
MSSAWRSRDSVHLIAHRGASAYAPANSVEAVTAASDYGATDVEIDLHSTADGAFVVTHDGLLDGSDPRWISELTMDEFRAECASTGHTPVALDDILSVVVDSGLGLYLDVKQILPGTERLLAASIDAVGYREHTVVASFRADIAMTVKRETGMLTSVLFHDPGIDLHALVLGTRCDYVHPCFDVFPEPMHLFTADWVGRARRTGAGIVTWNTLDEATARDVLALGVDGICSDDPRLLVAAQAAT